MILVSGSALQLDSLDLVSDALLLHVFEHALALCDVFAHRSGWCAYWDDCLGSKAPWNLVRVESSSSTVKDTHGRSRPRRIEAMIQTCRCDAG